MESGKYQTKTGEEIELTSDGLLRYPDQNCLYGSACPITGSIGNVMQVTGCDVDEAIQMASTNPACLYGLTDRQTDRQGKDSLWHEGRFDLVHYG